MATRIQRKDTIDSGTIAPCQRPAGRDSVPSHRVAPTPGRSKKERSIVEPGSSPEPEDLDALIRALAERDTLLFDPVTGDGVQACGKCGTCGVSTGRPPDTEANINIIRERIIRNPELLRDINDRLNIRIPQNPAGGPGGGGG
jgi:hypothetical protein